VALIVLLIACINFMNLSTARSTARAKEIGIRKVIGAKRREVIRQFFCESILMSFLALAAAIILAYIFLPTFNRLAEKTLSLNLAGDPSLALGLAFLALVTGLLSGGYPALYLSAFQPVSILKGSIHKRKKGLSLKRALIVFQFTAAVILIISTSVILKQMRCIRAFDLGFNRSQIITVSMDDELLE
jgi:putative ABC transport system permease protein